ncbi:MAG: AEC family transporter [Clostridiales bacterium]|nr:AEC family transporter [Clostridiales bacterium]
MQQTDIIIRQIIMLVILGMTGYLAGKTKYLPESCGTILSQVVVKLTTPLLLVTTMANYTFTSEVISQGIWIFIYGIVFITFSFGAGIVIAGWLKLKDSTANVFRMSSMFGNVIFLAYPLLSSLYGDKGIIFAIFFNLANDLFLWTLGVYLVNRHKTTRWQDNLKHLVNGNTVSFGIGLLFMVFNLHGFVTGNATAQKIYNLFYDSLNPLGRTTIYLSMVFIGMILSEIHIGGIREFLSRKPLLVLSAYKLLVIPFIALLVLYALGGFVDPFVKTIVVMQLAMPCATIVPALAAQYGSDYKFATEAVFISTILGVVTLPLMLILNGLLTR